MTQKQALPRFVPVIFANGIDDDAPGIQAAVENRAVQFGKRIYEPGETMLVEDCCLRIAVRVVQPSTPPGRDVIIDGCRILLGGPGYLMGLA
jgi:hypothetical protein